MMRNKYGEQAVNPNPVKPSQKPVVASLKRDPTTKKFVFAEKAGKYTPHKEETGGVHKPLVPNLNLPRSQHKFLAGKEQTLMPGYTGYIPKKSEVLVGNTYGQASRDSYETQMNERVQSGQGSKPYIERFQQAK